MKNAPRQYQNQRLGRAKVRSQQVLEVSIRREKDRERKFRSTINKFAWVILFSAMAAGAWVGTREGLRRLIWENPALYLTDVRVKTDGTLTRAQIISTGGVVEGSNIFTLNEDKVRTKLLQLPQVERVDVQRSLPHRVDIEVQERQPIAWLTEEPEIDPTATDRSFLIDRRGWVMKPRKTLQEYFLLPIISGVELGNLVAGQKANTLQINAALELLRLNAGSDRWQIKSIDVRKLYCLVVTDRTHAEIIFGLDDIDKQLSKLNRLLDFIEPQHREIQTVNLQVKWNTPVTFAEPDTEFPAAPTPAKPEPKSAPKKPESKPVKKESTPAPRRSSIKKPFRLHE